MDFTDKNVFFAQKSEKWAKFYKILGIDKNTIDAQYVKIVGHFNHFKAKYWLFTIFGPILYIYK